MDSRRKFGRETWQILLATVLGLVFVEIILLKKIWEHSTMNLGQERIRLLWAGEWPLWQKWTSFNFDINHMDLSR